MDKRIDKKDIQKITRRAKLNVFIALIVSIIALAIIVFFTIDERTFSTLRQARLEYVFFAFALTIISYFLSGLTFNILAVALDDKLTIWQGFQVFTGANFVGLTAPFHVANIPVQAYFLNMLGISYANSIAIVVTHGILSAWFFALVAPLIIFLTDLPIFGTPLANTFTVALILIFIVTILLIIFIIRPAVFEKAISIFVNNRFFRRFTSKEKLDVFCKNIIEQINLSSKSIKYLFRKSPFALFIAFLAQVFSWLSIIATVPVILIGLNWTKNLGEIYFRVLVLNFFLPASPIPGGSGLAELGIFAALSDLIPSFLIAPAALLWRFVTFYLIYVVAAIFFFMLLNIRRKQIAEHEDSKSKDAEHEDSKSKD